MGETQYTFTRQQIIAACVKWELDVRDGKAMTHEQADAMQINDRAKAVADSFLKYLND